MEIIRSHFRDGLPHGLILGHLQWSFICENPGQSGLGMLAPENILRLLLLDTLLGLGPFYVNIKLGGSDPCVPVKTQNPVSVRRSACGYKILG